MFDSLLLAVIANRFEAIVREMTNTLQRAGRSGTLSMGRDFSCSIVTSDDDLLASAEGLPAHIYGSQLQTQAMRDLHSDLSQGDAFLHNDVYLGNSHAADHTLLVPVMVDGVHLFTTCTKAHLSDVGNSLPTSYMSLARDVYEEGAIIFPCVRVQRTYHDVEDVIRMCRRRIRVPEQWYGDYLAMLGAARIGERRLKEVVAKYGAETLRAVVQEWFEYSERRMINAIRHMPKARVVAEGQHDPFPGQPEGIPLKVIILIDPERAVIEVDLRENVDCVEAGTNESEACAVSSVMQGIFSVIDPSIPHNAGSFRRVRVHLRENCVVGLPRFPHSCSLATTNPANRLVNLTQGAVAELGAGWGLAEGGMAHNAGFAVISGSDWRRGGAPYVNQMILGSNGGPASATADGWVTYGVPVTAGLLYRDSVEVDEQKYPIHVRSLKLERDSGGPGRYRGAPGVRLTYGPKRDPMIVTVPMLEGHVTPAKGVRGGGRGSLARAAKIEESGNEVPLPSVFVGKLSPGEWIIAVDCGGGGYGDPLERDPERVRHDVLEKWVSMEQARMVYGVVFKGRVEDDSLTVDQVATKKERRKAARKSSEGAEATGGQE